MSPLHKKDTWTDWRRARKATKMIKHREAAMWGEAERTRVRSALRMKAWGTLSLCPSVWRVTTEEMGTAPGVPWKRPGVVGTSYPWGDPNWTPGDNFSQWEQWAIGIISPGKWWNPQLGAQSSWKGFWTILSRLCFCQGTLGQTILQFPSNLVFCDSLKLNSSQTKLATFWGLASHTGE